MFTADEISASFQLSSKAVSKRKIITRAGSRVRVPAGMTGSTNRLVSAPVGKNCTLLNQNNIRRQWSF